MVAHSKKTRSQIMAAVGAKHTKPELMLRRSLSARGLRYRLHRRDLPGSPDIAFIRHKVAIFVDGDFWHGKLWERRKKNGQFKTRRKFWVKKIENNIKRDRNVNRRLRRRGWSVIRYWESQVYVRADEIAAEIHAVLRRKRHMK